MKKRCGWFRVVLPVLLTAVLLTAVLVAAVEPPTAEQRTAMRREMIGALPESEPGAFEVRRNAAGEYVYDAASLKPILEGGPLALDEGKLVPGLTVARLQGVIGRMPDGGHNNQVYWTLGAIEPGAYWVNVWYQSGNSDREARQHRGGELAVYLNGRMIQLATHGDPVQVAPGVFFAEVQAADAVALRPGDELAVGTRGGAVARLVLRQRPTERGPHRVATNFGGHQWDPYTALGLNVDAIFMDAAGKPVPHVDAFDAVERRAWGRAAVLDADGLARVDFVFANPLSVPLTVAFTNIVRAYYFDVAARDEGTLTIPAHARVTRTVRYPWAEDEPAHMAFMTLRAVDPPSLSAPREQGGLGWPEHEVYSYFPGHRHALPWPDPFTDRSLRRLTLARASQGERAEINLNGRHAWQFALTSDLQPPMPPSEDLEFKPANMPFRLPIQHISPPVHGVYLRRTFVLPPDIAGRSYRVSLGNVLDEATVYVNGQRVGNVRGSNTPLVGDFTRAARPGTNEIVVVVRDLIAIMNPDYVNSENPVPNWRYLDAPGLHGMYTLSVSGAAIESSPAVSVEEAFAITSTRQRSLAARLTVANRGETPVRAKINTFVLDEGRRILNVGETELELLPHQPVETTLESAWADPRFWGPTDPHLYALVTEVTDATTGVVLDRRRDRFGFRESWIDGPHLYFNGIPIRPKGTGLLTRLNPEGEFRFMRFSRGDWSDEVGVLGGRPITGIYNTASQHNAERQVFWDTALSNAMEAMKPWRNRPSLLAWDLSNEWLCFAQHAVDDIMVPARQFKRLSDAVRASDPTRWTFFNGDGDLWGLLDNQSHHYMSPYFHSEGAGMRGVSPYFPDAEFWRPLDRHYFADEEFPKSPFHDYITLRRDKQVIMDSEFLWKVGSLMPPGTTEWVGEETILSPSVDSSSGPIAWMWKTKLDGHRDLGVATCNTYSYHAGVQRGAYLDRTFIIPENQRRGVSGRVETRRFTVLNGVFHDTDMRFAWELLASDGKILEQGEFRTVMPSAGHETGAFSFTLPVVTQPSTHTLRATLEADGRFVSREEWDIEVYPDKPVQVGPLARQVMLFEPEGDASGAALTAAGVAFERVSELAGLTGLTGPTSPTRPTASALVIAENALTTANAPDTTALADWVAAGGRVLVLRQSVTPQGLPVITALDPRRWSSQVYVRMGAHPVMEGLTDMDLHFWQPNRAVSEGAYAKPPFGNAVTLADSGGPDGMEWSNLLEVYRGNGSYLLCQLSLVSRWNDEPMARELFARLVRYAGGAQAHASPTGTLAVVAADGSPIMTRLEELGAAISVQSPVISKQSSPNGAVLVDASAGRGLQSEEHAALAERLRQGATVVVVGSMPQDAGWLSDLAGAPVSVAVPPYRMWDGRGYRRGWSRWTAGLSHLDLYWKRYDGGEHAQHQAEDPSNMIEPLQHYAVSVRPESGSAPALEHVFPGALVEVAVGSGRLLFDQRRWHTNHEALSTHSSRNLSALLTGLDVAIAPVEPPSTLPREVAYRTVDLTPFANRGLVDETAEDGVGGWSDQGPRCDLRMFPTGPGLFKGVPFAIGREPNVVIVLRTTGRPGYDTMPQGVDIPLGFAAEGLYFMHGTAFTGPYRSVRYTMTYADGETEEILWIPGENINDWAGPKPLLRERGTQSVVAWTGRNEVFPLVGVYRMLWVNPRPEVPLVSVRFDKRDSTRGGVPILMGLTAAVRRDAANAEAVAAARARLDAAESAHDDERIFAATWVWGLLDPNAAAPWTRMGELLEKQGDARGALEAYRKSLAIEWNNPPVIEAARRLEAAAAH